MSLITRSIYSANPSAFDATQAGVSIGDLVVDPAGINSPTLVKGPNSARTVIPLGGAGSGSDLLNVTVVAGAPASGLTTINALVKTSAGVIIPNALLVIAFTSTVGVAPTIGTGVAIGLPSYGAGNITGFLYVRTNIAGILVCDFSTGSGAVLAVNISSVTASPGASVLAFISP